MIEFAVGPSSAESIVFIPAGAVVVGEIRQGRVKRGAIFTRAVSVDGRDERRVAIRIDRIQAEDRVWDVLGRGSRVTLELTGQGLILLRPHDLLTT